MIDQMKRQKFNSSLEKMAILKKYDMKPIDKIAKDFDFLTSPDLNKTQSQKSFDGVPAFAQANTLVENKIEPF